MALYFTSAVDLATTICFSQLLSRRGLPVIRIPQNLVHSIHATLSGIMHIATHHTHSKGYVGASVVQIDQATNQPLVPFSINWFSYLSAQFELLVNGRNCGSAPQHTCLCKQI